MSKKESSEEKETESVSEKNDWKDTLLTMLTAAFKQYTIMISEGIHGKISAMISDAKKLTIITVLLALGFIFVLVGSAQMISELLECNYSVGYIIVGVPLLLIGVIMEYARKK